MADLENLENDFAQLMTTKRQREEEEEEKVKEEVKKEEEKEEKEKNEEIEQKQKHCRLQRENYYEEIYDNIDDNDVVLEKDNVSNITKDGNIDIPMELQNESIIDSYDKLHKEILDLKAMFNQSNNCIEKIYKILSSWEEVHQLQQYRQQKPQQYNYDKYIQFGDNLSLPKVYHYKGYGKRLIKCENSNNFGKVVGKNGSNIASFKRDYFIDVNVPDDKDSKELPIILIQNKFQNNSENFDYVTQKVLDIVGNKFYN